MAQTITLGATIAATQPLIGYRPLAFPSLTPAIFEPAVTMANLIIMTILGPPFAWRWNRYFKPITFTCAPAQTTPTDYRVPLTGFVGWIEWASVNDLDANNPLWRPMNRVDSLSIAEEVGLPRAISYQYDDDGNDPVFRVMPAPDQAYPVQFDVQQKAVLFNPSSSSVLTTFWPIPDDYSHLYTWGFQALALALAGDPRFAEFNLKFVSTLLATHQGLSDVQRSDFLNNWMGTVGGQQMLFDKLTQGTEARGK